MLEFELKYGEVLRCAECDGLIAHEGAIVFIRELTDHNVVLCSLCAEEYDPDN